MRLTLLALASCLAGCSAGRGVVITRADDGAVVRVDAERLPSDEAARSAQVQALAKEACGHGPARVAEERASSREELQLDLDRVWAKTQRGAPVSRAASTFQGSTLPSRSAARDDAQTVTVPVVVLAVECGG